MFTKSVTDKKIRKSKTKLKMVYLNQAKYHFLQL